MATGDYTVTLGRLGVATTLGVPVEELGDGLDAVGAFAVPGDRRPRPWRVEVPVRGGREPDPLVVAARLRRQLRAWVENPLARVTPVLFTARWDIEQTCWVLVATAQIEDATDGALGEWKLTAEGYRVASATSHRSGVRVEWCSRLTGGRWRDAKRMLFNTDFSAFSALSVVALPPGAGDVVSPSGALPTLGVRMVRTGGSRGVLAAFNVVVGAPNASAVAFERDVTAVGRGDVVAVDRRLLTTTHVYGHSMNTGYGLADPVRQRWGRLRADLRNRGSEVNGAVNGSYVGADNASGNGGFATFAQAFTTTNRDPSAASYDRPLYEVALNWQLNDAAWFGVDGASGPAAGDYRPVIEALRFCASRARMVALYEAGPSAGASDAAWGSWAGSWTDQTSTDKNGGAGWRQAGSGAAVTLTTPGVVAAGQAIAIGGVSVPGNHALTFKAVAVGPAETRTLTWTVNGNSGQGFTDGSRYGAWVRRFANLAGGGPYTVTITTSGLVGGGAGLDGAWVEYDAAHAPPVTLADCPRLTDPAHYALLYGGWPHIPDDAALDIADAKIRALAAEFDSMVAVAAQGAALGRDPALRIGDFVHPNAAGHRAIDGAFADAAAATGEDMLGPSHERLRMVTGTTPGDMPALENGLVRIRWVGSWAAGSLAVDVPNPTYPAWDEIGRVRIMDQSSGGGAWNANTVLLGADLVEWTPERAVVCLALARNAFDTSTRCEAFVTLDRGSPAPRFEAYTNTGIPGQSGALGLAVRLVPNVSGAMLVESGMGGRQSDDPGVTWNDATSLFTFNVFASVGVEPWQVLANPAAAVPPVALIPATGGGMFRVVDDTGAYGGSARKGLQLEQAFGSGAQGYASAVTAVVGGPVVGLEAETYRNAGSGTTSQVSDANARGGLAVQETQAADTNATLIVSSAALAAAGVAIGHVYQVALRARETAGSTTHNVVAKALGSGGTTGATIAISPTTSLSGATHAVVGEVTIGTGNLEVHAWRASGAADLVLDAVILTPLERRAGAGYDGARDHERASFADQRAVPVLLAR